MERKKKIFRRTIWTLIIGFFLLNIIAIFHSYKFTHYVTESVDKTKSPEQLGSFDKLKTLVFGVNNPRPSNKEKPAKYIDLQLQSNKKIDCWYLHKQDPAIGTIILFHGYSGEKSSLLQKADEFEKLNYNILLVDFMGSGGSEGNQTTLGFKEAEEVKTAFDYLTNNGEKDIYLFGTSMGAVAIMKAIADYDLKPKGIILECPFGSLYHTTCARFKMMRTPTFPMAALLVFWGGVQNDFWALGHNPTKYAKHISYPVLLLYGEQDKNVSRQEIDDIYKNLQGRKTLKTYKFAGHGNYLANYKDEWKTDIQEFLQAK